jgi:purine-nucleoside phosphorylase
LGEEPAEQRIAQAVEVLRRRGFAPPYDLALVLGTGLGGLLEDLEDRLTLPYAEVPHFPRLRVSGHAGRITAGACGGRRVLVLEGRTHYYETGDPAGMRVPIGAIAALGAPPLLLTNAAGAVRPDLRPGDLVLVTDHLNLSGIGPLAGESSEGRFVSLTDAYDGGLRESLIAAATAAGLVLREGVYMWFPGPSFETPAEIRAARVLGADLVGMSTVPEVVLARFHGLGVAALSVVTNLAAGIEGASPSHGETKDAASAATPALRRLLHAFLERRSHA